jgi:WD40 repeat protein
MKEMTMKATCLNQNWPNAGPFAPHTGTITCAAFSPDGGRVITASHDATARLWDVATFVQIDMLRAHEGS